MENLLIFERIFENIENNNTRHLPLEQIIHGVNQKDHRGCRERSQGR